MTNQGFFTAPLLSLVIAAPTGAQAPPPAAPSWAGWARCQITIQAPGYSHRETHLWTMTGAGTTNANMEIYPASWTVTGDGSLQRVSGPTTVSAQWTVNGTLQNVTIGTTRHLDRITVQRWTNHGPARSGLTGSEVSTTNGVPRSRAVILDVQQWAFPGIDTGTTSTRATGSNTVPFDGLRGPMNPPSGALGTAACSWDFARGGASASAPPPSTATAPPTPSSGAPVSDGATVGGGTSTSGSGSTADLTTVLAGSDPAQVAVVSWPANGTATYQATFRNGGPAAADGAVVRVPASAGLSKTSAGCSAFGGAQCPAGLTVAQLESGVALPIWPSGGSVNIRFPAAVTGAAGTAVRVTATATAPPGASDPDPGNNSYTQTQSIVASTGASGPTADLYVDAQATPIPVADSGVLIPIAFGNNGGAVDGAVVTVVATTGVLIGNVTCSIQNSGPCLATGSVPVAQATAGFAIPTLPATRTGLIMVNGLVTASGGGPVSVTVTITPPAGVTDPRPQNNSYTVTATAVAAHAGAAAPGSGGGAGPAVATTGGGGGSLAIQMTADLSSFVYTSPVSWPAHGNATYDVTVRNSGPQAADGATITIPASPGLKKWMVSCAQFRGPSWNVPIAEIERGFVIPTLAAGSFVECIVSAIVTGAAGTDAALTVRTAMPGGVDDPNPGNNSATHTLPIR